MKEGQTMERAVDEGVPVRSCRTAPILCEQCTGGMLLLEEAIAVTGTSSRALHRFVEAGTLHFIETREGLLLFCLNSVLANARTLPADTLELKSEIDS